MMMLQVRAQKDVYDDKGNLLGSGGALLPMDAPIRASDRSKVVPVDLKGVKPDIEEREPPEFEPLEVETP